MSEVIAFQLDVEAGQVGNVKKEIREMERALFAAQQAGKDVTKEMAALAAKKDDLGDFNDAIRALDPGAKAQAFANLGTTIAGGFQAATGAAALFGGANEELQETLLKVQAATALAQGVQSLADAQKDLSLVKTVALTTAQQAYTFVVGTTTGALKLLRLAYVAVGFGAIVVAIGLLASNWEKVTSVVSENLKKLREYSGFLGKFLEMIGILDTAEEEAAEANLERATKKVELSAEIQKQQEREIALAKAQGKSANELRDLEVKMLSERFEAYRQFVAAKIKAGQAVTQEEKDQLNDLRNSLLIKIAEDRRLTEEENKKKKEEARKAREERRKEQQDLQNELNNERIKSIQDARLREIAELEESARQRLEKIKGHSAVEIALRKQIEENKRVAIADVNKRFDDEESQKLTEEIAKEFEESRKKLEAEMIQLELDHLSTEEKKRQLAALERNAVLTDVNATANDKLLAEANYQLALAEIEENAKQEKLRREQELFDAKIGFSTSTITALGNIGNLLIQDGKKAEAFQKKLALVQLAIDTAKSISATIAGATAAAASTGPAAPFVLAGYIATGIATVFGAMAQAQKLLGSSGSSSAPSIGGGGGQPRLETQSGVQPQAFDPANTPGTLLSDNREQSMNINVKAQVVETEMTESQTRVKKIEESASF